MAKKKKQQDCSSEQCESTTNAILDANGNRLDLDRGKSTKDKDKHPNSKQRSLRPGDDRTTNIPADSFKDKKWQLTKNVDSAIIERYANESLAIGGADLNVYKLLGVHEQERLVDETGMGNAISGGDLPNFPSSNAFDITKAEWRSVQRGADDLLASSYLGYDFGVVLADDNTRRRYGENANVRKNIAAISIKQSRYQSRRITKARIERSDDKVKWYGVTVITLPDDDCLNTILFNDSVPMRYWRIRPLEFNGSDDDIWAVVALQLHEDHIVTNISNIQDKLFLENRDRDYAKEPITIKGSYDMLDTTTDLTEWGIQLPNQMMYVMVGFQSSVELLGRPLVIGDIIELPSEAQFSPTLERVEKWMEVTDIGWSTEGYAPGWLPTLQRVILQPAYATQETQDIFGDLAENFVDDTGLVDNGDGQNPRYQDWSDVSDAVKKEAESDVPMSGRDFTNSVRHFSDEELERAKEQDVENLQSVGLNRTALYVEDAMPPNNEPFTEGPEFPDNPKHGAYHRMTYEGLSFDVPARLYRFSSKKGRWVFLERDKRGLYDPNKPRLEEFLLSDNRKPHSQVVDRDRNKPNRFKDDDDE